MTLSSIFNRVRVSAKTFVPAEKGHVAITFALTIVPIIGFIGAAVDYTRANNARSAMQAALDSTSLMLTKDAANLSAAELTAKAQAYFAALYNHPETATPTITATYTASKGKSPATVKVSGTSSMATNFMKVVGQTTLNIDASSTAAWGNVRMRVALALDTTGSMSNDGKMTALKPAAKDLIDQLSGLAKNNGDVYISIVPFSKDVNVGTGNKNASWLNWTDWDNDQKSCGWEKIKGKWNYTCTSASHTTWNGCVTDRDQNYDTMNTAPTSGSTLFPAEQYGSCPVELMSLSYNWTQLKSKIDTLSPAGTTNQAIGLAWAWHSLSQTDPLNAPSEETGYQYSKVIIIMSDGLNTRNRWYSSASQIDARQATLCNNIKAAGVTIYAIHVNTSGDPTSTVLQNCASDSSKFFVLTSASQLAATFSSIGSALSKTRLAY